MARPKLPNISGEMKVWSAALAGEVTDWPRVMTRAFFGLTALYRRDTIFAVLPRTRAMETANSLGIRLEEPTADVSARLKKDPRIGSTRVKKARWFTFEFSSNADLHDALGWLNRAYEAAGKGNKSR